MAYEGVYGRGLTKQAVLNTLRGVDDTVTSSNTWTEAENAVASEYTSTQQQLSSAYQDYLAEAYAESQRQKNLYGGLGLVGQAADAYQDAINQAYLSAQKEYQSSLYSAQSESYEQYLQNMQAIQEEMNTRAENFAQFGNLHYDYLQYLYKTYDPNAEGAMETGLWSNPRWQKLLVYDEETNSYNLRDAADLYNAKTHSGEEGEIVYDSIYDENGVLTPFGREYFDLIENYGYGGEDYLQGRVTPFTEWLFGENPELYSYMYETNNYADISSDGTNVGTFREITGRSSDDYTYSVAEHFGGMDRGTIKGFFKDINEQIDTAFSKNLKNKGADSIKEAIDMVDSIQNLARELGIEDAISEQMSFTTLRDNLDEAYKEAKRIGTMTGDWFLDLWNWTWKGGAIGAGIGGGLGSIPGSAVPGVGTLAGASAGALAGGVAGALVGFVGGIISASIGTDEQRNKNKELATESKNQLKNVVDAMTNYSIKLHEQQLNG